MMSAKKKVGISLVLLGVVLLVAAFVSWPLGAASTVTLALTIAGCALVIGATPLMWAGRRHSCHPHRQGIESFPPQPAQKRIL